MRTEQQGRICRSDVARFHRRYKRLLTPHQQLQGHRDTFPTGAACWHKCRPEEHQLSHLQLTIGAWCQKTRDWNGSWQPLENSFQRNPEAALTHGICPPCAEQVLEMASL